MALNNMDAQTLRAGLHGATVLNVGSWGMTLAESASMLEVLAPRCRPRTIVLPVYYGDFGDHPDKHIDWDAYRRYIDGEPVWLGYLRALDPAYYVRTYMLLRRLAAKGNAVYESLRFDDAGSVLF